MKKIAQGIVRLRKLILTVAILLFRDRRHCHPHQL